MNDAPLLDIRDLHLAFDLYEGRSHVLNGVNLRVGAGERVGLVGESGCGKSLTARAALGLLEQRNVTLSGEIHYRGKNLFAVGRKAWRGLRGREMTMIYQDPMAALNPLFTIADQMVAVIKRGGRVKRQQDALEVARTALGRVSIEDPDRVLRSYPFQLSGGASQRVMITMALANDPDLVIADEPGTSLDVTIQDQTLRLMEALTRESSTAVLLIAHNLGVIREFCERVYVMYAGSVVEEGRVEDVFREPLHPYTKALFAAVPRLSGGELPKPIEGMVPDYTQAPEGCRFHPRCPMAGAECRKPPPWIEIGEDRHVGCVRYAGQGMEVAAQHVARPHASSMLEGHHASRSFGVDSSAARPRPSAETNAGAESEALIEISGLSKTYMVRDTAVHALREVDLTVLRGECLAVVGESASGKTTLGRLLLGIERPTAGTISFAGTPLHAERDRAFHRRLQLVQQNPMSTLNPKRSIYASVSLPLAVHGLVAPSERRERAAQLLELVGISADYLDRFPTALSGGQRQRIALARALAAGPDCVVLDEPTSSLDVSVQARVLELLLELRKTLGLTYIFITHDLSVVRNISDRVVVLYRGRIVETGDTPDVFARTRHRYTQMLLSSIPVVSEDEAAYKPEWRWDRDMAASEKVDDAGCAFAPRCPYAEADCRARYPSFRVAAGGHRHACVNPG